MEVAELKDKWIKIPVYKSVKCWVRKRIQLELTRSISGSDVDAVAQDEIETIEVPSRRGQMKPRWKHKKETESDTNDKHAVLEK